MNSASSTQDSPSHAAVGLLVALGLLIVTFPTIADFPRGELVEAVLLTLVMVSAVRVLGGRPRTFVIALVLVIPALAGKWINYFRPDLVHPLIFLVATVAFYGFVVAHLLRFLVRAPKVDVNVLCAGISGFLMVGLLWIPLYLVAARLNPGAFLLSSDSSAGTPLEGFNAFYFSFITLATVGYGDVTPLSKLARMLAVTEALTGLFYMAVFVSRLVSIYSTASPTVVAASERGATGASRGLKAEVSSRRVEGEI